MTEREKGSQRERIKEREKIIKEDYEREKKNKQIIRYFGKEY